VHPDLLPEPDQRLLQQGRHHHFFCRYGGQRTAGHPAQLDRLEAVLRRVNDGHRCVYLGSHGCMWTIRPVVCAMFLCDRAMKAVFNSAPEAKNRWESMRRQEKTFKWPDRPVLFDRLEKVFLDLGYRSTLMHLNLSPGLLRVKAQAGLK
jgi:hypothetical protein